MNLPTKETAAILSTILETMMGALVQGKNIEVVALPVSPSKNMRLMKA